MGLFDKLEDKRKEIKESAAQTGDLAPVLNTEAEVSPIPSPVPVENPYVYEECHKIIADSSSEIIPKQAANIRIQPPVNKLGGGKIRVFILDPKYTQTEWISLMNPITNDFYSPNLRLFNTGVVPVRINKGQEIGWFYDLTIAPNFSK